MNFLWDKKYIVAAGLLSAGLLAGIFVLARQRGGIMALGANLGRAFDDNGQWVEIKPRAVDPASAGMEATGKSAPATKAKTVSKTKGAVKIVPPAIKWCEFEIGGSAQKKAIINEVAWMGTAENYSNEWIELKNNSGQAINLGGWQLQNKNQKIKILFNENDILLPSGLYLMERTDDNSAPETVADKIYSGGLGNTNEALYLFDAGCQLQDLVVAAAKWPAGNNVTKQTMARSLNLSWQSSAAPGGTPKGEN